MANVDIDKLLDEEFGTGQADVTPKAGGVDVDKLLDEEFGPSQPRKQKETAFSPLTLPVHIWASKAAKLLSYKEDEKPSLLKELGRSAISVTGHSSKALFPGLQRKVFGTSIGDILASKFGEEEWKDIMTPATSGWTGTLEKTAKETAGFVLGFELIDALLGSLGLLPAAGLARSAILGASYMGTEAASRGLDEGKKGKDLAVQAAKGAVAGSILFPAIETAFLGAVAGGRKAVSQAVKARSRKIIGRLYRELKGVDVADVDAVVNAAKKAGVPEQRANAFAVNLSMHVGGIRNAKLAQESEPLYDAAAKFLEEKGKFNYSTIRSKFPHLYDDMKAAGLMSIKGKAKPDELLGWAKEQGYSVETAEDALKKMLDDYRAKQAGHAVENRIVARPPEIPEAKTVQEGLEPQEALKTVAELEQAGKAKAAENVARKLVDSAPEAADALKAADDIAPNAAKAVKIKTAYEPEPIRNYLQASKDLLGDMQAEINASHYETSEWIRSRQSHFSDDERRLMFWAMEKKGDPETGLSHNEIMKRLKPTAKKTLEEIRDRFEKVRQSIIESPYIQDVNFVKNYLTHRYDLKAADADKVAAIIRAVAEDRKPPISPDDKFWKFYEVMKAKGLSRNVARNPYAYRRIWRTYHEALTEAGVKPLVEDPFELLRFYENTVAKIKAHNKLLAKLGNFTDEVGRPLRVTAKQMEKGNFEDYIAFTPPGAKAPVYVNPQIGKYLVPMLQNPYSSKASAMLQAINGSVKYANFALSLFHHLALTQSALASMGLLGGTKSFARAVGRFSLKRGIKELADAETRKLLAGSGLVLNLPEDVNKNLVDRMIEVVDKKLESIIPGYSKLSKVLPINKLRKANDKLLWEYLFNTYKIDSFFKIRNELLARAGNIPERVINKQAADMVNSAFGGINWERLMVSRRARKWMQYALLSPDWNTAMLRQASMLARVPGEAKGVLGRLGEYAGVLQEGPHSKELTKLTRQWARKYWVRMAFQYYMLGNMLNYAFTGHPMWDNSEGCKYAVELPFRDSEGHKLCAGFAKQMMDVIHFATRPLRTLYSKASPVAGWTLRQITGMAPGWYKEPWYGKDLWESLPERAASTASTVLPFSFKNTVPLLPFPVRRELSDWRAVEALKDAMLKGDAARVYRLYKTMVDNKMDAKKLFRIAKSKATAERRKALRKKYGVKK